MKLRLASTALLSSATLLLLSIGPLCTAADANEAGNIKVESAANQNGPDVASDLVCPLFLFYPVPTLSPPPPQPQCHLLRQRRQQKQPCNLS
jgi:hypothetical protein